MARTQTDTDIHKQKHAHEEQRGGRGVCAKRDTHSDEQRTDARQNSTSTQISAMHTVKGQ